MLELTAADELVALENMGVLHAAAERVRGHKRRTSQRGSD